MRGVITELEDREHSIKKLLEHVEEISDTRKKIDVIVVLKSSLFIAFYNNIEATTYSTLERLHDKLSSLQYDELSEPLRKKMLRYSFGKASGAFMSDSIKILEEENKIRSKKLNFPTLAEYLKRQQAFSGNIDTRQINIINISYGIPKINASKTDAENLLWIKNKRNKIAHGEQSMSDGGQGIVNKNLKAAFTSTGVILREFIYSADRFLSDGDFRNY